jgi:hypothetical protein
LFGEYNRRDMSPSPERSDQDCLPEITLRIPGPWESPDQLKAAMAETRGEFALLSDGADSEMYVLHKPSKRRFRLGVDAADDELAELFFDSPRGVHPSEVDAIQNHKVELFISGPGGSIEAARAFLAVGKAFIEAGAAGVMVDNSGNCHGPRDWLDLANDKAMGGMYWAFVSVTATESEVFSAGMHCLGFRDAELPAPVDRQASGMMMHEFLGYTYQSGVAIVDGDPIGGPDGPEFFLPHIECTRIAKDTPWHNPFGVWRLEKV